MEVKELRIGNFVYNGFNEVIQIEDIISKGNTGGYRIDTLNPIPITEEWLLKLGFENMVKFPLKYVQRMKTDSLSEFEPCISINNLWIPGIKYIHQLQNLYYSLTGQELTLKSNP